MASALPPVRGVAFSFEISLISQADTDTFQDNPTLAAGDVKIIKDGTLDGNIDTLPTAVTSLTRVLTVPLSTDEMTADRVTVLFHDAAGNEWQDAVVTIYTAAQTLDTTDGIADDIKATVNHADYGNAKLVRSTSPANTLDVNATGEAGIDWANVGGKTSTVALTNTQINSVLGTVGGVTGLTPATVADAVWDEATSGHAAAGSTGAALTAAGALGDPWSVELPGAYASTEAGGIIGMLAGIDTSAVTVTSSNNAGVLTFTRGVTFAATVSGLTISGTWAKLYFTVKESDYDTDEMALIQLVVTNPAAALTDGLLYLDGSGVASPITHADGTLTVSQAAGTVAIAITDNATVLLSKASGLVWDIKTKDAAGATVQNATGTASITQSVTQTI